jgi:hypothetical protein
MRGSHFALLVLLLIVFSFSGSVMAQTCNPLSWPDVNPVWSMCWVLRELEQPVARR